MIILSVIIFGSYTILILSFIIGFDKVPVFQNNFEVTEKTNFSVLIPFRNEAENLPILLDSIKQLQYSLENFEILMVDDSSEDNSLATLKDFKKENPTITLHLLDNIRKSNSPKKDAIETAIKKAKFEWIITTDADCQLPQNWLKSFDAYIQSHHPKMIIAPVSYKQTNTFFDAFQFLDFLSLQGSTIGGFGIKKPFLCNGANLCYEKKTFLEINAFDGNNSIASGDDIFILEKVVQKYPEKVYYLKSAEGLVKTNTATSISELLQQRVRWASKTSAYQNSFGKIVGLIVFISNLFLLFLLVMATLQHISWAFFGLAFLIKFNIDFVLLFKTATFFQQERVLKNYVLSSIIHPFFIVLTAILSFGKSYQWKGRNFSK
jgi:glycosyltransferase involved in cell wall biosynthesis